jgi:hypothetical protein
MCTRIRGLCLQKNTAIDKLPGSGYFLSYGRQKFINEYFQNSVTIERFCRLTYYDYVYIVNITEIHDVSIAESDI